MSYGYDLLKETQIREYLREVSFILSEIPWIVNWGVTDEEKIHKTQFYNYINKAEKMVDHIRESLWILSHEEDEAKGGRSKKRSRSRSRSRDRDRKPRTKRS